MKKLILGTRGSKLALWQAKWVQLQLEKIGYEVEIKVIKTTGDKITDVALAKVGGKGLFTKEIEEALLRREIDLAVHSMKDVPVELPAGLIIAAIPPREDPRDVLIGTRLEELKPGLRIGTSSLRRQAQLQALKPGIEVNLLRGNVDTRLKKLKDGHYDAIVLAAAGLKRMGLEQEATEYLDPALMVPAVGQGALAIETLADSEAYQICRLLNDPLSEAAVRAERAFLRAVGGGCQVPIGAYAQVSEGTLLLRAIVLSTDGKQVVRGEERGAAQDAETIGTRLGQRLLEKGAAEILTSIYRSSTLNATKDPDS